MLTGNLVYHNEPARAKTADWADGNIVWGTDGDDDHVIWGTAVLGGGVS